MDSSQRPWLPSYLSGGYIVSKHEEHHPNPPEQSQSVKPNYQHWSRSQTTNCEQHKNWLCHWNTRRRYWIFWYFFMDNYGLPIQKPWQHRIWRHGREQALPHQPFWYHPTHLQSIKPLKWHYHHSHQGRIVNLIPRKYFISTRIT